MVNPMNFDEWRNGGRHFEFHGHSIFYQKAGTAGPSTLLCIHGFPTASWDWHALWPGLTRRFDQLLAPDLLGFGWSAKPQDHDYSVVEQAELCEALLREQEIRHVHLLAHDLGDSVAQELLARDATRRQLGGSGLRIQSLVLLNGGLFPETHRPRLVQRLLLTALGPWLARRFDAQRFGRSFAAVFGARTQPTAQELDEFWRLIVHAEGHTIMHRLIRYIPERRAQRTRWVNALQDTPVPQCLIVGMDDPVSGAHMAERYRALVAHGDVVPLHGIGHYPQVEAPQQVLGAIEEFHMRLATVQPDGPA